MNPAQYFTLGTVYFSSFVVWTHFSTNCFVVYKKLQLIHTSQLSETYIVRAIIKFYDTFCDSLLPIRSN